MDDQLSRNRPCPSQSRYTPIFDRGLPRINHSKHSGNPDSGPQNSKITILAPFRLPWLWQMYHADVRAATCIALLAAAASRLHETMPPFYPASAPILEQWFHGMYTATMLVTVWLIVYGKTNRNNKMVTFLMVFIPWLCSSVHAACGWHWYQSAINGNEDPRDGGPGLKYSLTHVPAWIAGVADTFFVINIALADSLFIWRCWCIWGRRWVVIVLPAAASIVGLVLGALLVQYQVSAALAGTPALAAKFAQKFINLSSVYFGLSVATSLTTTILISIRILQVQASTKKYLGKQARPFNPIIEIFIESAMLYSATLLTFVAFEVQKSPNLAFAQDVHSQIAGLAPLLILLRISAGQSRPQEDWSSVGRSSIAFGPSRSTLVTSSAAAAAKHPGLEKTDSESGSQK
ncbi:hypothetical protein MKEN_01152900 [Mycena kentingensis (nom. inval.)]|nr:hypothetical protein MKEN_01152900 [Mycena kentingensis (nom. inval.)]